MPDAPKASQYVVIRGGLAEDQSDDVDVIDVDVLESRPERHTDRAQYRREIDRIKDKATLHGLDDIVAECNDWLDDNGFEPEVEVAVAAPQHEPEW